MYKKNIVKQSFEIDDGRGAVVSEDINYYEMEDEIFY